MLKVHNLSFGFGSRQLFKDVSFSVEPKTLIHLKGPNGAGKSTLLALLVGLIGDYKGEIIYSDVGVDPRLLFSWLPPDANALDGTLSAFENIASCLNLRLMSSASVTIAHSLHEWGLKGEFTQRRLPVQAFSTGMKRRLALARLCMMKARLWILDEPLFGLDVEATTKFQSEMRKHLSCDGAVLIVTHDERVLEGLTPKVVLL